MNKNEFSDELRLAFTKNGVAEFATDEICDRLYELYRIFSEVSSYMNLTAIRDEKGVIYKHFTDCVMSARLFPQGASVLDVGSGGGMPALPLKIARPDLTVTALDATAKKVDYITDTASKLGIEVRGMCGRAEELGTDKKLRESYDVVTARAVAELRILSEWCIPFIKQGGKFIALKGKRGADELSDAERAIKTLGCQVTAIDTTPLTLDDGTLNERTIIVCDKISHTAGTYPRSNAQIQKKPL